MSLKVGIIGLGRCGMPAAKQFIKAGFEVYGYARRPEVIAEFSQSGGHHKPDPGEVAQAADIIVVMVLNDQQVLDVISGPQGVMTKVKSGSTLICMSTINRSNLQLVAEQCAQKGVDFIDCPFTGGPARIEQGTLTLIAAAPQKILDQARPVLEAIGDITYAGEIPGMGQAIKHCNQLLVTAIHAATIELITLAEYTGQDPALVCEVVGSGIGGNDYFRLLSKAILENTTSPGGMGQLWKDVNIVVTSARSHNLPLLVANSAAQYFNMAVAQDMATEDSARLIKVLQRMVDCNA